MYEPYGKKLGKKRQENIRSSTVMLAGSYAGWGTELPCDSCVQVDMQRTGLEGYACNTWNFHSSKDISLRSCYLVWYFARSTLSIYWLCMRYRTEPLRHRIARRIMIDSLLASLHWFRNHDHERKVSGLKRKSNRLGKHNTKHQTQRNTSLLDTSLTTKKRPQSSTINRPSPKHPQTTMQTAWPSPNVATSKIECIFSFEGWTSGSKSHGEPVRKSWLPHPGLGAPKEQGQTTE